MAVKSRSFLMKNQSTESTDGDGCIKALKWGGTGKTRITRKTTEIPERPKNNRGLFPLLILSSLICIGIFVFNYDKAI